MLDSGHGFALEIGWAKVEITPPFSTPLAGYANRFGRKSTGLHDPLFVRALIVAANGEKMAIVGADLLLIHRELREEVIRQLGALRLSSVLLYATHTHSGVGGYWDHLVAETFGMGWYEQRIFDFLVDRLATAIRQAHDKMIPAKVGSTSAVYHDLSRNRRHSGAPVASEIGVIRFDNLKGKPEAAMVNFAAHPTILGRANRLVSGDYPGVISRTLEKQVSIALFVPGATADLTARHVRSGDMYTGVEAYGTKVAELTEHLLDNTPTFERATVRSRTIDISLPPATLGGALGNFPAFFVDPILRGFFPTTTRLQAVALNKDILTAWPGEVASDFHQALNDNARKTPNDGNRWILSQANDHLGYIQTEQEYLRGSYETSMSFYGPKLGSELMKHMLALVQELREK